LHVSELVVNQFDQGVELLANIHLWSGWQNLLHQVNFFHDTALFAEGLLDEAHRNLLLMLSAFDDDADAAFMEADNDFHHTQSLVEWAVVVEV
jgi:hypothetical protein